MARRSLGAWCLVSFSVLLMFISRVRAEDAALVEARTHIARGEGLYDAENYEGALAEFQRAHTLLERHPAGPQVLYNLALCHERLGHYAAARDHYARYLSEAGSDAPDRKAVEAAMRTLEDFLGALILRIRFEQKGPHPKAEVWIDQRLSDGGGPYFLPSGRHTLEIMAEGYESVQREVELTARTTQTLDVTLVARARALGPALFWTGVGLTAASGVTTAVLGARALGMRDDAADKPLLSRTDADRRDVRKAALASDVALGATSAFALGTVILFFLTDFERKAAPPRASVSLLPASTFGLSLSGPLR